MNYVDPKVSRDLETALAGDDKLELRLWLRLLTCSNLIEQHVRNGLREDFATTLPRFDILAQLDRSPDGLSMGELSSLLMVSNGNVTGLIDRLANEGLVARQSVPGDRRTIRVRLTERGKAQFDQMTPAHERWIDDMLGSLAREDQEQLYGLLGELKKSIRNGGEG
jgi:DNA-binding MarR family transcriptional regulator